MTPLSSLSFMDCLLPLCQYRKHRKVKGTTELVLFLVSKWEKRIWKSFVLPTGRYVIPWSQLSWFSLSVWVITWLSAVLWHSYKCCSQKSERRRPHMPGYLPRSPFVCYMLHRNLILHFIFWPDFNPFETWTSSLANFQVTQCHLYKRPCPLAQVQTIGTHPSNIPDCLCSLSTASPKTDSGSLLELVPHFWNI